MIDIYLENIMGRTIIGLLFLTMGTQRWTIMVHRNKNPPIGNGCSSRMAGGVQKRWQSGRQPLSFYVADSHTFECLWLIAYMIGVQSLPYWAMVVPLGRFLEWGNPCACYTIWMDQRRSGWSCSWSTELVQRKMCGSSRRFHRWNGRFMACKLFKPLLEHCFLFDQMGFWSFPHAHFFLIH